MIWAALILSFGAVTAAMVWVYGNKPRVLEDRARKRVVVTTKGGASYRGVLFDSDSRSLVLRSAEVLSEGVVPVDGELLLERVDVQTIQIP